MDIYSLPVPGAGGKTCSQIFELAGCEVPASPSCAACLGGPRDTYARMNEPQASLLSHGISLEIYFFCPTHLVRKQLVQRQASSSANYCNVVDWLVCILSSVCNP